MTASSPSLSRNQGLEDWRVIIFVLPRRSQAPHTLHRKLSPLPCARRQDGVGHLIDMLNVTVEPTSQSLLCLCRRRADIFRPRGLARYRDTRLEPDAGCARLSGAQMFRAVRQLSSI